MSVSSNDSLSVPCIIPAVFEGVTIHTLDFAGRPAWIAREVGTAVGYLCNGKRLASKIRGDWCDEFIEGHDYMILQGDALAQFKGSGQVPSKTNSLLVLFETGLYLALVKTQKPLGIKLRRFIVDEVLPNLMHYTQAPNRQVIDTVTDNQLTALVDRKFQVHTLQQTISDLKGIVPNNVLHKMSVLASEVATGVDLSYVLQDPTEHSGWLQPSTIAQTLGVSANRVGRVITKLGLRGDIPGMSMHIVNKSRSSNRDVISYVYTPAAAKRIEEQLLADGYLDIN